MKAWLERNKILFETVAAVMLSVMAIFISWQQFKVAEMQTRIAERQVLPQFVIVSRQVKSSVESQMYDEDILSVENKGAVVSSFSVKPAVLFNFVITTYGDADNKFKQNKLDREVFVQDYYFGVGLSPTGQGLLATVKGGTKKNHSKAVQLENDLEEYCRSKGWYSKVDIKRFVNISYVDLLGREHNEYYFVPLIYGAARISEKEGRGVFERLRKQVEAGRVAYLNSMTVENVLSSIVFADGQQ